MSDRCLRCSRRASSALDDFTGLIVYEPTLATYAELLAPANLDIILRTVAMAALVTIAAAIIAFPIAYFAARYARGRWKVFFYLGDHAAALVELSGARLRLEADPRQGGHPHLARRQSCTSPGCSTRSSRSR